MTDVAGQEIEQALSAIGRVERENLLLDLASFRRFSFAIGGDGKVHDHMPVLGHWVWLLGPFPDAEISADGHPRRGGFLPALPSLQRRMFAGARVEFLDDIVPDMDAEVVHTISDVTHKSGHSGDLVFVAVERTTTQAGALRVRESQTYVYRGAGDSISLPTPEAGADIAPDGGEVWCPNPVNLFRFSAATQNSHRIHYDAPYSIEEEGFPALVVHGPFIAAKLAELAARKGALAEFSFRAQAPSFVDQPIRLQFAGDDEVQAVRCDGAVACSAKVKYR